MSVKMTVENFGPFEKASLELKPLTILIGKNSVGKSILTYLLWTILTVEPDFEKHAEVTEALGAGKLAEEVLKGIRSRRDPREKFLKLVEIMFEAFPEAIASSLHETLQRVFLANPGELIRESASRATILIEGRNLGLEVVIEKDGVRASYRKPYLEFIKKLKVSISKRGALRVLYNNEVLSERTVISLADIIYVLLEIIGFYVYPFFISEASLLPDSRAGISRTLLKPYPSPRVIRGMTHPDEIFISLYYKLTADAARGLVDFDMLRPLLEELGCTPEVVFEGGVYAIYLNMWSGKRLSLPQAPSGVRAVLPVALALASRGGSDVVFIEEPEAHLHPRAQRHIARLIARAVNELGKTVVLTTHSDYILYTINNLIALSMNVERAESLGFHRSEALKPESVAVYLVKAEGRKAVLERLGVTPEGVSEEEFSKIARELAEERAKILD